MSTDNGDKIVEVMAREFCAAALDVTIEATDEARQRWADRCWRMHIGEARAALTALTAAGYAVVPVEPTPTMVAAGVDADDNRTGHEAVRHIGRAMIAAAQGGK